MKLYLVMVGLPARGKSTLAKRIRLGLEQQKISAAIFNNGEVRRVLYGLQSASPEFFNPENRESHDLRMQIAYQNMERARAWLEENGGDVAILDATNGTLEQRNALCTTLQDHPMLFIECVNKDEMLLDSSIKRKIKLPEFASLTQQEALDSFHRRLAYYESVYVPLSQEHCWMRVDSVSNTILAEAPSNALPYYAAIRDIVVSQWVQHLYLVRHMETSYNLENRLGGDPPLTEKGFQMAARMAEHFAGKDIPYIFTSTKLRSAQTARLLLQERPGTVCMEMKEFDEINAGVCEGMSYSEVRDRMPLEYQARAKNKYNYVYPRGESYAILKERVAQGLRRALFLAGEGTMMIVGHQAINRTILSLFLFQRSENVPYIYIPQEQYYHITITQRKKLFEMLEY